MTNIAPCDPSEVRALLEVVFSPKCNPNGLFSMDVILAAGQCFKMTQGDKIVGAYVLQAFGADLWVTAAAGEAENDLSSVMAAALQYQGAQFDAIVFTTSRPGLMKKALAHGYTCRMRKQIKK